MVVGADVTHTHPGSGAPSIVAVVCSVDPQVSVYHTYIRAQDARQEIINDTKDIMTEALQNFRKKNDRFPERIIFFRDGVSDGEFAAVKSIEVAGVHNALAELSLKKVPLTFVTVQKRHHHTLFPNSSKDTDQSGNCMPGTIVDTGITHPIYFNYILQSHAGIQGTSRPVIYSVLHDENEFTSDQIQQLSFNLCFTSQRATRSISKVAPAYRAHIAAYYARVFLETDGSDNASVASREGGRVSPIVVRRLNDGMRLMQYYMVLLFLMIVTHHVSTVHFSLYCNISQSKILSV